VLARPARLVHTRAMTWLRDFDDVPDGRDGLEVDPHWLALQRGSGLPPSYMPDSVPGVQAPWRRLVALVLLVVLVGATAGGICLTYGPSELFHLLEND
jgi:hypothetical protein